MTCPHCGSDVVIFTVPPVLHAHAPDPQTAICTHCLRTEAVDHDSSDAVATAVDGSADPRQTPDFSAIDPAFPDGESGVALALLCGALESFALNRASIEALIDHAERSGADVFAFLDRLDATDAAFDLDRRRAVLLDLL